MKKEKKNVPLDLATRQYLKKHTLSIVHVFSFLEEPMFKTSYSATAPTKANTTS